MKIEDIIPEGLYCYNGIDHEVNEAGFTVLKLQNVCPFHRTLKGYPSRESGYCLYLQRGDFADRSLMLLWDMVKECDINPEDFEDLELI